RQDDAFQLDVFALQAPLHILDAFPKLDLLVLRPGMAEPMGVDKDDALAVVLHMPEDEVGVKPTCLKEADALLDQVAQQEELFTTLCYRLVVSLQPPFQILDETELAVVKSNGFDADTAVLAQVQQRVVEMGTDLNGADA